MAIFKCKMCSHYDGEWCYKTRFIKTQRKPCESCSECKIKLTDKIAICPYKQILPDWLVWVMARLAFCISVLCLAMLAIYAAMSFVAAITFLMEKDIRMMIYAMMIAAGCLFLVTLLQSLCGWIYRKF